MDWGLAGAVTFTGLVVVFAILLLLVLFCYVISLVFKSINNRPKKEENSDMNREGTKTTSSSAPIQKAVAAPAAQSGVTGDVVAAISAAIACILGPGKQFVLRSVKRVGSGRNAWNAAGIAENTRPF